jgi:hypothetical protein
LHLKFHEDLPDFQHDPPRASLHAAGISNFEFPAGGAYAFPAVVTTKLPPD